MQIKPEQLSAHLRRGLLPLYILAGEDSFVMEKCYRIIKKQCSQLHGNPDDPDAFDYIQMDCQGDKEDTSRAFNEICTPNLFASHTFVRLQYRRKGLSKALKEALQNYCHASSNSCTVVLLADKCKVKDFSTIAQHTALGLIPIFPMGHAKQTEWIQQQLKKYFSSVPEESAHFIASCTKGNAFVAEQILKKLRLCFPAHSALTPEEVEEQVYNQCNYDAFELSNTCLNGDIHQATAILDHCIQHNEDALILWVLSNETRTLLRLHDLVMKTTWKDACIELRIWASKSADYKAALHRCSLKQLQHAFKTCAYADSQLKQGGKNQLHNALHDIVYTLCQTKDAIAHA